MIKRAELPEVIELEREIDEFLEGMANAKDDQEFEMYRQMIKVNICLLKDILKK